MNLQQPPHNVFFIFIFLTTPALLIQVKCFWHFIFLELENCGLLWLAAAQNTDKKKNLSSAMLFAKSPSYFKDSSHLQIRPLKYLHVKIIQHILSQSPNTEQIWAATVCRDSSLSTGPFTLHLTLCCSPHNSDRYTHRFPLKLHRPRDDPPLLCPLTHYLQRHLAALRAERSAISCWGRDDVMPPRSLKGFQMQGCERGCAKCKTLTFNTWANQRECATERRRNAGI